MKKTLKVIVNYKSRAIQIFFSVLKTIRVPKQSNIPEQLKNKLFKSFSNFQLFTFVFVYLIFIILLTCKKSKVTSSKNFHLQVIRTFLNTIPEKPPICNILKFMLTSAVTLNLYKKYVEIQRVVSVPLRKFQVM